MQNLNCKVECAYCLGFYKHHYALIFSFTPSQPLCMCKNASHHYLSLSTRKWQMQLDVWRQKVTHHVNSTAKVSLSNTRARLNSSKPNV